MKQANNPTGGPWFRVPGWLGGRYRENRPATDGEAWIELLGRWHQGEDVSLCDLCKTLQWGKGRVIRLHADVRAWAVENGAVVPTRVADRQRTGNGPHTGPGEPAAKLDNPTAADRKRTAHRTEIGPETDREPKKDSVQARVFEPLEEREVEEKEREIPPALPQGEAEPDWEAIAAATLKARDAEIDSYFTSPIEPLPSPKPEPTTRKPAPDFAALFGGVATPKPEPKAEPEPDHGLPPDLDLLQMLTSRPDGAQATAMGVATRWQRLLVTAGIDSPQQLCRYTVREIQMLPGMSAPSAGHVQAALEAWGGAMARSGRELVDDLRRRILRNDGSLTAAEKRQMEAANLRTSDIKRMTDFDVNTYAQRLDAARSRM